ncbi:MAG: phosphoglucosamine mutase [Planctomycetota bacterium]|nr:phosphoglucosamine mutase [Planctomycetota bacterium]
MIFGTDGVRDIPGTGLLTPDSIDRIGQAVVAHLAREGAPGGSVLVARDTRVTGGEIESLLAGALRRCGCTTIHAGVLPTPAVSLLLMDGVADLGLVISASHNPPEFNGIKILDSSGAKLAEDQEQSISENYDHLEGQPESEQQMEVVEDLGVQYLDRLLSSFPKGPFLAGLKVVLDCARGAACHWGPEAFRRAGADVTVVHGEPDGARINVGCGSLHPEFLGDEVKRTNSVLGIAFDGDADRALFSDETGQYVDGDDVIVIWARSLLEQGLLDPSLVALTVMSNVGVEDCLRRHGIEVVRTGVGDRAVADALRESGGALGGEPSGHIIHHSEAATGDGIRTGLAIARCIVESGQPLSRLCDGITRFPQEQKTLRIQARPPFDDLQHLSEVMTAATTALGSSGRILVRYSGTEPLLRILVEAKKELDAKCWIDRIEQAAMREGSLGITASA